MGLFGKSDIVKFKDQDYGSLHKRCVGSKELFEDSLFTANDHSLNLNKALGGTVVWKRPPELCENPSLFVEKASSKDVTQGRLGNCWFVSACATLATVKALWSQVIPDYKEQEWNREHPENYGGIFIFRFWRFGKWLEVVVDDRLPTIDGQLIFCHSNTENEFWSALLEKAYAKLCGSYGAMEGGTLAEALADFTSGLSEMIELKNNGYEDEEKRNSLRKMLLQEHEEHSLMCSAITASDSSLFETRTKNGLVLGHAYGITSVKEINLGSTSLLSFFKEREKLTLLRLRNPWGAKEWNGPFSDSGMGYGSFAPPPDVTANSISVIPREQVLLLDKGSSISSPACQSSASQSSSSLRNPTFAFSPPQLIQIHSRSPEWMKISKSEKEKLGLTFEDDGEFWIPFDDFVSEFSELCICHLINTSAFTFKKKWYEITFEGEWTLPNNAGGCPNHPTFLSNPQYCFEVPKDDMALTVMLIQTDMRGKWTRQNAGTRYKSIGFHVMRVEDNRKYRAHHLGKKALTSDYIQGRSVYFQGSLDKGKYILLPTTFDPKVETEYFLRIYTDVAIVVKQLVKDYPTPSKYCALCCSPPMCVTSIKVEGARGLAQPDNTYCIIRAEREKLKSAIVQNSQHPVWNLEGVFFRYDICKPIFIELWAHRLFRDQFLGCAVIAESDTAVTKTVTSPLVGRGRKQSERHPGELSCTIVTYDDLSAT